MNFKFNTPCGHHGTIEPAKSNTGTHAGKWVCRVNRPGFAAQGVGVETIYTAPYVGAAKAAIAKFLKITVSELDTVQSSPGSGARQGTLATSQTDHFSFREFDENDDEFASFDLQAAVSSATKKPPPLTNKNQQKMSPMNPYKLKQSNTPNQYGASVRNGTPPTTSRASASTKPPQYPKPNGKPKSSNLNSSRLNFNVHNANVFSSIQEEQKKLDGLREESKELRLEKERLQREITMMKQEKEELVKEANVVREENERLRAESNSSKETKDKLKGQIRAIREEHEKAKSDLKAAKQQKETSEEGARTARKEKEQYEGEAKATKELLDSRRAELDDLTNQNLAKRKPAEESNLNNAGEPPKKKRRAGKQAKSGTLAKSMKVGDLKEEAVARGMEVKEVSRMNKTDLLHVLVIGSTCITKTDAWGEVLSLRKKFENERREAEEQETERQHALQLKHEAEERDRQEKTNAIREKDRAAEIASQVVKHKHHFPKVHGCKLAKTDELLLGGDPRSYVYEAHCKECNLRFRNAFYSCEKCEYDICEECFSEKKYDGGGKEGRGREKGGPRKTRARGGAREASIERGERKGAAQEVGSQISLQAEDHRSAGEEHGSRRQQK